MWRDEREVERMEKEGKIKRMEKSGNATRWLKTNSREHTGMQRGFTKYSKQINQHKE